jgi:hypothetical protein
MRWNLIFLKLDLGVLMGWLLMAELIQKWDKKSLGFSKLRRLSLIEG